MFKSISKTLLIISLCLLFSGVSFAEEVLRIGITPNTPPIIYKSRKKIVGLEADMAKKLCEELAMKPKFVELKWMDQIPALLDGKIDIIMSGMTITYTRNLRIAFSEPYLKSGQLALVRARDTVKYRRPVFILMTDGIVGVEKGTTGQMLVQQNFYKAKMKTYTTLSLAVKDLKNKKIDMFVHDAPVIWNLYAENETEGLIGLKKLLTEEYYGWGIRREDRELLEKVNAVLNRWNKDGTREKMVNYWMPYL